ncbi:hypothetical protein FM107_11965 [Sphingobacterium sp. JB170]|nr:hypothetical protein FM107_11965 [Sphingobacterium sp. JB170]
MPGATSTGIPSIVTLNFPSSAILLRKKLKKSDFFLGNRN